MSKANNKLRMKLLVDKTSKKVLFAEADKEVVDFLFSILTLPVACVISLLSKRSMAGSLKNLYENVEGLEDTYLQPNQDKNLLLRPRTSSPAFSSGGSLAWIDVSDSDAKASYYRCSDYDLQPPNEYVENGCGYYYSADSRTTCPGCGGPMTTPLTYVPPVYGTPSTTSEAGFVKRVVTYMVTDDLSVTPMSVMSSITLLNRLGVEEVSQLEERTVDLGMDEGLEILTASLQSTSVLTNAFLVERKL